MFSYLNRKFYKINLIYDLFAENNQPLPYTQSGSYFFFQDLTNNISDTRTGVTDVKTFIDGMRSSRDTKMSDMTSLKTQLKDQNERMIKVTQDKARLEAKNKARQAKVRHLKNIISGA